MRHERRSGIPHHLSQKKNNQNSETNLGRVQTIVAQLKAEALGCWGWKKGELGVELGRHDLEKNAFRVIGFDLSTQMLLVRYRDSRSPQTPFASSLTNGKIAPQRCRRLTSEEAELMS